MSGDLRNYRGTWTPAALGHARGVARMRERGHSPAQIRQATAAGRPAFGYVDEALPPVDGTHPLRQASRDTGLKPGLIERIVSTLGWSPLHARSMFEDEVQLCGTYRRLEAGLPPVAMLQLVRVYGQAMAQWRTPRYGCSICTGTSR